MKVLVSESIDKRTREYIDVPPEFLLKMIENDYGLHEVIDMGRQDVLVRMYFDIDAEGVDGNVLENVLEVLNQYYGTENDDWAITEANTERKQSYHIYSKKYSIPLNRLWNDVKKMGCCYIDDDVYSFSIFSQRDEGSMRLPNQSKKSINKDGGIHRVIQGELRDCLITQIVGLVVK